jgi:hypothetical protein
LPQVLSASSYSSVALLVYFRELWDRARKIDSKHRAALLHYERHSQLTDDIFLYKRELTEVGKDLRAYTWRKKNEGSELRRFICLLNKRTANLQK